jgi:hypothetical protein
MSELDMKGKAELIAQRGSTAFYVIRRPDGRVCYSIGDVRKHLTPAQRGERMRFGSGGCIDPRVFPTRAVPVLDFSSYMYRPGDTESRLIGLQGFAADPVATIGVIGRDKRIVFSVSVQDNVYSAARKAIAGARGIVAFDKDKKVLWVQCTGMRPSPHFPAGGCGQYKNSPPPNPLSRPQPTVPRPPPGPPVAQRGSGDGVSVVVHGAQVEARLGAITTATERLLRGHKGKVNLMCFKLVPVGGKQFSSGVGVTRDFAPVISARLGGFPGTTFRAPYDGCTVTGLYGHAWNDAHGTHDAVEVPLTPRGRRYFVERAVARDITWLARSRVFYDIRYGVVRVDAAGAVRRLGGHLAALDNPQATPALGKLGIWMGDGRRIVLVERAQTGRRFYLELRRGIIYKTNLTEF